MVAKQPDVTGKATLSNSFLGNSKQIAFVTRDLQRTMEGLVRAGIGPWRIYTFGPDTDEDLRYRGRPASYSIRVAFAASGRMNWEIIQPLTGPSIYEEFLEKHGEGVHHVAFTLNGIPWEEQLAAFEARGYEVIQSGASWGKLRFAYFETEGDISTTAEIFDIPADFTFPAPESWYPAPPPAS